MKNLKMVATVGLCLAAFSGMAALRSVTPQVPDADWTKSWWKGRHEQKLAEIRKTGGADIVFLGDSITHIWEDPSHGLQVWNKYFAWDRPYRILNLGFSGDRTEHVLWRIEHGELDGYSAKAVVLLIGTNNAGHFPIEAEPPEATILAVRAVVRAIRAKQPTAKIILNAIFPRDDKPNGPRRLRNAAVNKEISKLANGRDILWLDCTEQFLTSSGELVAETMPDFLHPRAAGYEIWANALIPYLNHALAATKDAKTLCPSAFAAHQRPEGLSRETFSAQPHATFGERWWGEFADRPLATMTKIADGGRLEVDAQGKTNRWFDVVMVGDSITHRLERPGQGGDAMWAQLTNTYAMLNLGYGGDTTDNCLWRMRYGELYGYRAKAITVMIGVNNNGKADTGRGIAAVVAEIRRLHPESKVIVMPILPRNKTADDGRRKAEVEQSADARRRIGEKDVVWLDIRAKFLNADGTLVADLFKPDSLHLSEKGYAVWLEALKPVLKEIVGK